MNRQGRNIEIFDTRKTWLSKKLQGATKCMGQLTTKLFVFDKQGDPNLQLNYKSKINQLVLNAKEYFVFAN